MKKFSGCEKTTLPVVLYEDMKEGTKSKAFTFSMLTIEALEQDVKWRRSAAFIVNFEHV